MSRIPFRFVPVPHEMLFDGTPSEVIVLWAVVYRLWDLRGGGNVAVGQVELGETLGWDERTVRRWAKRAQEAGWLAVLRRGLNRPNEYTPLWPDRTELSAQDRTESAVLEPAELSGPSSISRPKERDIRANGFDGWWRAYPRKVAKKDAERVWGTLSRLDQVAAENALPAHVKAWKAQHRNQDKVPYPATWLRGRRWEDDLAGETDTAPRRLSSVPDREYVPPPDPEEQLQAALNRMDPEARALYD